MSKTKAKPNPSDWEKLRELIAEYAEAYVQHSWRGGGDPAQYEVIESTLLQKAAELNTHIEKLEREAASL